MVAVWAVRHHEENTVVYQEVVVAGESGREAFRVQKFVRPVQTCLHRYLVIILNSVFDILKEPSLGLIGFAPEVDQEYTSTL